MLDKSLVGDFLGWLRDGVIGRLSDRYPDSHPRLTTLVEVPGDPDFNAHACSYALQLEFATLEAAHIWSDESLAPVIEEYTGKFGIERAAVFTTILEEIYI